MDRDFTLPVSFAVAVHAALLFGFSKSPRIAPPRVDKPHYEEVVLTAPPDDPVDLASGEPQPTAQKPAIDRPLPTQPERPAAVVDSDFRLPVPKPRPFVPGDSDKIIPPLVTPGVGGPGGPGGIIPGSALDKSPRTRFQPAPVYPWEAKQQALTGEVRVEFVVDERGRVIDPHVVSSTNRVFEEPTLRAVSKWVFEPGRRGGEIVRFRMSVPVFFNLNES